MSETVNHGFGETAERIRDLPVPGKRSLSRPFRSSLDAAPSQSPAYDTPSSRVFAALKSAV